jgi:hypothetical protein
VFIDDKQVIHEQLETNLTTGVCMGIRLHKNEGNHAIQVVINGTATKTEVFSLKDDLYIGVNYDQLSKDIFFNYNDQPFGYD